MHASFLRRREIVAAVFLPRHFRFGRAVGGALEASHGSGIDGDVHGRLDEDRKRVDVDLCAFGIRSAELVADDALINAGVGILDVIESQARREDRDGAVLRRRHEMIHVDILVLQIQRNIVLLPLKIHRNGRGRSGGAFQRLILAAEEVLAARLRPQNRLREVVALVVFLRHVDDGESLQRFRMDASRDDRVFEALFFHEPRKPVEVTIAEQIGRIQPQLHQFGHFGKGVELDGGNLVVGQIQMTQGRKAEKRVFRNGFNLVVSQA